MSDRFFDKDISFVRLSAALIPDIIDHMSDPRTISHMPLSSSAWDYAVVMKFLDEKEKTWRRDGLGHWAILLKEVYIGWGGFQKEGDEWDFGLVLKPDFFGIGPRIAKKAFQFARQDPRIPHVTFLLPLSRQNYGALSRLGAQYVDEVDYQGHTFRKFRLDTD